MKKRIVKEYTNEERIGEKIQYVRDVFSPLEIDKRKRREFGIHLTSSEIFKKYIFPEIKNFLYEYIFVDLFCGEGNLILPILEFIPKNERIEYFKKHIYLFDIQKDMIEKSKLNAEKYGIPKEIAEKNIIKKDTLENYPNFIKNLGFPVWHITNPPYLYIGYIVKNSQRNLKYFTGENLGYQDLYQIALINDLRNKIPKLTYIIPTNFLFGFSVSNKIRMDFLPFYNIKKAIIFESKVFEYTGTNVCILFFERKKASIKNDIHFQAIKIGKCEETKKNYILTPKNFYRAGNEFEEFVSSYNVKNGLKIEFYLTLEELKKNKGDYSVKLLDVNSFSNGCYKVDTYKVNQFLYNKIKNNPLFVRTLDTGKWEGRAGIYDLREIWNIDGILVTKEKYRTHPIQIFIEPNLNEEDLNLLKNYFNLMLEYFRDITDSEFLTTFKYSISTYVRKYLGLLQVKKLIETLPLNLIEEREKQILKTLILQKNVEKIKEFLLRLKEKESALFNFKNE